MSEKAQYRTRQITELENYLCSMEGKHVTVSDICKYFKSQGISIGTTTVYRQLDRMVEQGLVAKYVVDGTSSACFEYLGHDEHCHKHILQMREVWKGDSSGMRRNGTSGRAYAGRPWISVGFYQDGVLWNL